MHELSIATELVAAAARAAREAGAAQVTCVRLRVGALSGVVPEALEFAWEFARDGTSLEGAALDIETVALQLRCAACGHVGPPPDAWRMQCGNCGAATGDVVAGRELEIAALRVVEPAAG